MLVSMDQDKEHFILSDKIVLLSIKRNIFLILHKNRQVDNKKSHQILFVEDIRFHPIKI